MNHAFELKESCTLFPKSCLNWDLYERACLELGMISPKIVARVIRLWVVLVKEPRTREKYVEV